MPYAVSYHPFCIDPFCCNLTAIKGDFITILKFCIEVRTEPIRCGKNELSSPQAAFFCVYKKNFSPISSKSLSNCREMNPKSLVAYKEELNSHLRHTYRDKCGELAPIASLGNMSLCVKYPFLGNYLRNQTRILSNKTKCTACGSLACSICVKWKKKDRLTEKCCNPWLFYILVPLKTTKQTQYYDHTPQSV